LLLLAPGIIAAWQVVAYRSQIQRSLERMRGGELFSTDAGSGHYAAALALQTSTPALAMCLVWLASQSVSSDLGGDTLRNTLMRSVSRGNVLFGKLATLAVMACAGWIALVVVAGRDRSFAVRLARPRRVEPPRGSPGARGCGLGRTRLPTGAVQLPLAAAGARCARAVRLAARQASARAIATAVLLVLGPELLRDMLRSHAGWLLLSHLPTGLRDDSVLGFLRPRRVERPTPSGRGPQRPSRPPSRGSPRPLYRPHCCCDGSASRSPIARRRGRRSMSRIRSIRLAAVLALHVTASAQTPPPAPAAPPAILSLRTFGPAAWRARLGPTNLGTMLASAQAEAIWRSYVDGAAAWLKRARCDAVAIARERPVAFDYAGAIAVVVWLEQAEDALHLARWSAAIVAEPDGKTDLAALAAESAGWLGDSLAKERGRHWRDLTLAPPRVRDGRIVAVLACPRTRTPPSRARWHCGCRRQLHRPCCTSRSKLPTLWGWRATGRRTATGGRR
jgi:hypothetical protein